MKTYLDCLPCMMNQALCTARIATNDNGKIKQVLSTVGTMIKDISMHNAPCAPSKEFDKEWCYKYRYSHIKRR